MKSPAAWAGFAGLLVAGFLLGIFVSCGLRKPAQESISAHPRLVGMDTADVPIWTNELLSRMGWVTTSGRQEGKTSEDSNRVVRVGLDDSAQSLDKWTTLALIRLHGNLGWECGGCAAVFQEQRPLLAIARDRSELVAQLRTPQGRLVSWMSLDTATSWSLQFYVDRQFQKATDSIKAAFIRRIHEDARDYIRRKEGGTPEPKERKWIVRETDLMGQFRHFSTRVVDLDLREYLRKFDTTSTDSVRFAKLVEATPARRLAPEEHGVLSLAGEIGLLSKSCYRRISSGEITFRSRSTGAYLVTSAWNSMGKPVAWNAIDSAWGALMPIWFHLDREACLETTDSVSTRPNLFHRLFHF